MTTRNSKIIAVATVPHGWIAKRCCTRIAQHLTCFHVSHVSRHGVSFPGTPIRGDTVAELNDALKRAGSRKVWA